MTLEGKTAFVSGSGHNIGRAIVLEFAGRGANVVVNGLSDPDSAEKVADEARSLGVGAIVAMGNVGDSAAVKSAEDNLEAAQAALVADTREGRAAALNLKFNAVDMNSAST